MFQGVTKEFSKKFREVSGCSERRYWKYLVVFESVPGELLGCFRSVSGGIKEVSKLFQRDSKGFAESFRAFQGRSGHPCGPMQHAKPLGNAFDTTCNALETS